jgi:hypothetical protein
MQPTKNFYNLLCHAITHMLISNFNPEKMELLLLFSQVFSLESKDIVKYLSRLLQEKQGYSKSRNIFNYEVSLVYGKSLR